ncbi:LysR family transcriptional regulator [Azomonas macrocytogenes]|uniref:DNA-binding transcriptional LysR family regulator n=1 Tax=Azomonas macrocytogenes TaxID=69962 RepID=A0A839T3I1_AZOMA|nr:LysR family transcriptional regulator [Azomonas macrocytogenes]MBB3104087.1 DNA-binding transcriptional LysR family regulator [Azomonas macrocytogenes]
MDRLEAMAMLLTAVEKGSLSAAAREMRVPVPTLTRKINDLEARLGTALLTRTTRKLALTDAGFAYIAAARRILAMVDEQEREASGEFTAPRGELVITAPVLFGRLHVLPEITDFLALFPEVNVTLMQADSNVDLVDEHVDLAVRIGNLPDSGLVATQVGTMRTVVCGSPAFLAGQGVPQTPADLARMPCVTVNGPMLSPGWRFREPQSGEAVVAMVTSRLRVTTTEAAAEAAMRDIGLTRLLHYQVAGPIEAGKLRVVLDAFEVEPVPIHLMHISRSQMPLKLRRFLDFAVPRLRQSLARFGERT